VLSRIYRRAIVARSPAWWALYGYAITHVIGANLSGLSVASIFPWEAFGVLAVPILWPRLRTATRGLRSDRWARTATPDVPTRGLDDSDVV
jgi:hypothetical protein